MSGIGRPPAYEFFEDYEPNPYRDSGRWCRRCHNARTTRRRPERIAS